MAGEWRPSTWGAEVTLEYGKAIRGYSQTDGKYRVFGSNGPIGWTSDALAQGPGVILGRKGAYRGTEFCRNPFWVIDTAYYLVPKTELDMRWLYYAVKHYKLGEVDDGSPIPSTTRAAVYMLDLKVPPIEEQRAIAYVLGTLDDKIELNRRRNETLEAMARALFQDWFVDFGPVRAKMEGREPYLPVELWKLFPQRLDEEGKPQGWKMTSASELVEFNPTEALRKGTAAPYLDMASLPTTGSWPEPPIQREFGSGMRFRNGDALLARITPCLENGKTAFVQCLPDDTVGWGSTEYIVMRAKAPVPAGYAYLLARDAAFREHAIRSMTGTSGRQRVQADSVATFRVAAPECAEIWHAFSRLVTPKFESIKANADASETLAVLRDTLLPKLISGELRVTDVETFLERAGP
ncbi:MULTISPECIES: restriction endonuclease subunit S [Burkholderia]|uniref:restriction endonuclease subunit S n=1 Tax=Burkholderia TaxID=32008 RepID=UPI0009B858C1|nr:MULTISPECIES: restriction endonuclease subunit S [Burkholderia]